MKTTLFLLTNNFPYLRGEEFLENEIHYLAESFQLIIIPLICPGKSIREIPENAIGDYEFSLQKRKKPGNVLAAVIRFFKVKDELKKMPRKIISIKNVLGYLLLSDEFSKWFCKKYAADISEKNTILYSYWFGSSTFSLINVRKKLHKNILIISRAHRFDVFAELHPFHYIPFREYCIRHIDHLFPVSAENKKYFLSKYPEFKNKIEVAYLGVGKQEQKEYHCTDTFHLLSCSYLVPVKSVHLIIDALSLINGNGKKRKIKWTHIGGGPEKEKLTQRAMQKLNSCGVEYQFTGHLTNPRVIEFYRTQHIDCFIITSISEGLPVSIMEALSFSLPVIATDVGGIREIVSEQNGVILKSPPTANDVYTAIQKIMQMPEDEICKLRKKSYGNWNDKVNAEKNYHDFVDKLQRFKKEKNENSF